MNKFNVIYADPPWPYDDKRNHKSTGMALAHYNTMSIDSLCNLDIKSLCDENCMLFLWATMPKLPDCIRVLKAWGFRYITVAFVWVKLNPNGKGVYSGLGHWTNANAELVLMGKMGRLERISQIEKQIVLAPRGKHSEKPEEVRTRIEYLLGNKVSRLELFSRRVCTGWVCVGDDITGNDIMKDIKLLTGDV